MGTLTSFTEKLYPKKTLGGSELCGRTKWEEFFLFFFLSRSEAKIGVEITVPDMNNKSSIMFSFLKRNSKDFKSVYKSLWEHVVLVVKSIYPCTK